MIPEATPPGTVLFDFGDRALPDLVAGCAADVMGNVIARAVPEGAAILEAGAGSGRWVKYLDGLNYRMTGIELNRPDVDRFRAAYPGIAFDHGSVENLPYPAGSFDAVLSFGVIEHLFDGPGQALSEAARVLKPGGVLIVTVPHDNASFRLERIKDAVLHRLLGSNLLRRVLGRPRAPYSRRDQAARLTSIRRTGQPGLALKFRFEREAGLQFYEYRFTESRLARLVEGGGFSIAETAYLYQADRLYQIFGSLVGRYDRHRPIEFNVFGRMLADMLPASWCSHMLVVVARKLGPGAGVEPVGSPEA